MYCIQYLSRVLDVIRFRDRQDPESESLSNVNMQLNIKKSFCFNFCHVYQVWGISETRDRKSSHKCAIVDRPCKGKSI